MILILWQNYPFSKNGSCVSTHISIFDDRCTVGTLRSRAFQRRKDDRKWTSASEIMYHFCQGQIWVRFIITIFELGLVVGLWVGI